MKYIDVSKTIFPGMKKYPTDPSVRINSFKSFKSGNSCNLCELVMGTHAGTHVDAPHHIIDGRRTVDNIEIEKLICNVAVSDIDDFLKSKTNGMNYRRIKGVLFKRKRKNSYLTMDGANKLLKKGITLIGIDAMSIENPEDKSHPVHNLLLKNNAVIVENLDLSKTRLGYYKFICLPLKIMDGDGAPVRAVLAYD